MLLLLSLILQIVNDIVGLVEDALALCVPAIAPVALLLIVGLGGATVDAPVLTRFRVVLIASGKIKVI